MVYNRKFVNKVFPPFTKRRTHFDKIMLKIAKPLIKRISNAGSLSLNSQYKIWLQKNIIDEKEIKNEINSFELKPLVSLVMPVYNVDDSFLKLAIDSVKNQLYENWELCVVDDHSSKSNIKKTLENFKHLDKRIKVKYLPKNLGIAGASNESLKMVEGTFVGFLDNDDELYPDALFEIVKKINQNPDVQILYTDEDKLEEKGERVDPFFKPDWSPNLLLSGNYMTHFTVISTDLVRSVDGFRQEYDGSQDYDLFLRVTELTEKIEHIPKILYGWRKIPGSAAESTTAKPYAYNSAIRALEDTLKRRGIEGKLDQKKLIPFYNINYKFNDPLVSIIIYASDKKLLEKCINSIEKKTDYKNYEIIIINNTKLDLTNYKNLKNYVILNTSESNHSKILNFGVTHAKGDLLLFLDEDIEVISKNWLHALIEQIVLDNVGIVGTMIIKFKNTSSTYLPIPTIYHAGIILDKDKITIRAFQGKPWIRDYHYYFGLQNAIRNCSAVTGSCLLIKKNLFDKIGGWNENLPSKYGDTDLCLRAQELGYVIVYTPFAELKKFNDEKIPSNLEINYFRKKWKNKLENPDPYYNVNFSNKFGGYDLNV